MMSITFSNILFKRYSDRLIDEMKNLRSFHLNQPFTWQLDWSAINNVKLIGKRKRNWDTIPEFKRLYELRKSPAVYFFTVAIENSNLLYSKLLEGKSTASQIRKSSGVWHKEYTNISFVPKVFSQGTTIYVGSVKNGLHGRLIQHLGKGSNGRTGALYLAKMFNEADHIPEIDFNYFILDEKYRRLTEHIECVIYDELKPFIGKRPLRND